MKKSSILRLLVPMGLIALFISSCSSDDEASPSSYVDKVELNAPVTGKDYTYRLTKGSSKDYFVSGNEYVCKVDTTGLISAVCCGSTTVTAYTSKGIKEIAVNVNPRYNSYTEPETPWGASLKTMRTKLGSKFTQTVDSVAILVNNNYETKATQLGFVFKIEGADTSLIASKLYIPVAYENEVAFFLLERYYCIDNNAHILINGISDKSCTSLIQMNYYSGYAVVVYYSFDYIYRLAQKTTKSASTLTRSPWQQQTEVADYLKSHPLPFLR